MKQRVCICCGETRPVGDFIRAANPNVCHVCAGFHEDTEFIRKPQPTVRKPPTENRKLRSN